MSIGEQSLTVEEFDNKHKGLLNQALELINTHPDIPEDMEQHEIMSAMILMGNELSANLHNRVPEIVALRDEIARKDKQITKLQETNQNLFLKVGNKPDHGQEPGSTEKPLKTFDEIKQMIDRL